MGEAVHGQCLQSLFSPPLGVSLPPLHIGGGSVTRAFGSPEQQTQAPGDWEVISKRGLASGRGSSGPT